MTENNQNILVIDDDQEIWKAYKKVLEYTNTPETSASQQLASLLAEGQPPSGTAYTQPHFELSFASQGEKGYTMLKEAAAANTPFSVAFIDIKMPPGWDVMKTATRIRQFDPKIEIVIVTAYTGRSRVEIVKAVGAPDKLLFLRKPFDPEELFQMALSLREKWRLGRMEEKARAALGESEDRFRSLIETTPDFVWATDIHGKYTYCSPICESIYAYRPDELHGSTFFEKLLTGKEAKKYQKSFEHDIKNFTFLSGTQEYCCTRKDGTDVHIESSATPIIDEHGTLTGFRGIDRDVSERNRIMAEKSSIEEQYRQSQKMEAIGTLAGGIAHDMNNLMTPIIGYAELLRQKTEPNSPLANGLTIIAQSAQKATALIRQILIFSRKKTLTPEVSEINAIVQDCMKMLTRMIREDIELRFELANEALSVFIDKSQVEQVMINLVTNARDSINGNGTITVSTKNISIPPGQEVTDANQNTFSGNYVVLAIRDTGSGIDPNTMEKIFEPFYTTKEVGKGTGLGLATVYEVIHQHNGHIIIDTAINHGTTFHIYLPLSDQKMQTNDSTISAPLTGGKETILVAEDDPVVQELVASFLQQLGYRVLRAANGRSATEEFEKTNTEIDLLITDVIMPLQNGGDLAASLREQKPDLPIIFISGYSKDTAPIKMLETPNTDFIQKPFETSLLAADIRRMIDQGKKGATI